MRLSRKMDSLRCDSRGQAALETAVLVPVVILILLMVLQGMAVMVAASQVRGAAREGARAQEEGRAVTAAVHAYLPSSVRLQSVTSCGSGCVRVKAKAPLGIPAVAEIAELELSASAYFPVREEH